MMRLTSRGLAALLAAGVAVIALALWVSSRKPSESAQDTGQLVLPGLEHSLNGITEVRLVKGDGTRTTLEKRAADWIIAERGFPADSSRVRKLLLDLAELKIIEDKTSDPQSYAELGVEPVTSARSAGTLIELVEPGKTVSLVVGKPSGMQSSYVRIADAKRSLLASPQLIPEADPRRWIEENVIDLAEGRVKDVHVMPDPGPGYVATRASAQQLDFTVPDLPKGRVLSSPAAANSVASALASLTLQDVRKAQGAPKSADHATFDTFDGLTVEVTGIKDGNSRYIELSAKSSSKRTQAEAQNINSRFGGWQIEVLGYRYDSLFEPLSGLLEKPAAPVKAKDGEKGRKSARAKPRARKSPIPAG